MKALLFILTVCTAAVLAGPQPYPTHAQVVDMTKTLAKDEVSTFPYSGYSDKR